MAMASWQGVKLRLATTTVPKLVSRLLSLGRVVQREGLPVVEQEHWVEVGSAVGLATSIVWGGHPVEQECQGEGLGGVGLAHC
jgi:hypothetical protein